MLDELRTVPAPSGRALPITILHPIHSLAVGGLERKLADVVNHLPRDRFRHVIAVQEPSIATVAVEIGDHVRAIYLPKDDPRFSQQLAQIIDQEYIDLLHVRGLRLLVDSVIAARVMRSVPVIASFHGFEANAKIWTGVRRKVTREALLRCQARWAVSKHAAEEATQRLNLTGDFFDIIPNGVDTDHFQPALERDCIRQALRISADSFVYLSVGNLKLIKGHDHLVRAFAKMLSSQSNSNAELILIGEDQLEGQIDTLADKLGIARQVRLIGRVDDVLPWLQAADAFVLPSLAEGHCNALLEAMACELPAIATRVGGNIDTIQDRQNGLLVDSANVTELSAAMLALHAGDTLRQRLGQNARDHIVRKFSQTDMIDRYADGYLQTLQASQSDTSIGSVNPHAVTEAALS